MATDSLGDFVSRVAIIKMLVHSLKTKLGVVPNLKDNLESTANTSLEYHAGEREYAGHSLDVWVASREVTMVYAEAAAVATTAI